MKDKSRFKKLFGIKVPCGEHFDYYISVLAKTHKHSNLPELVKLYEQAEEQHDNFNDFSHRKSYEIIDFLKSTITNQKINDMKLFPVQYNKKPFKYEIGTKYLSVDLIKANWQVFKGNDDTNELPNTYEELLDMFKCPEILKHSKKFRQFIFGNLNPKRHQTLQAEIMSAIMYALSANSYIYNIVDHKHDEILICDYDNTIYDFLDKLNCDIRLTEFIPTKNDGVQVHEFYELGTDKVIYKDLFGSNGNQLYMDIKKYILEEEIELRDLYFRDNGKLAIWADDKELLKQLL